MGNSQTHIVSRRLLCVTPSPDKQTPNSVLGRGHKLRAGALGSSSALSDKGLAYHTGIRAVTAHVVQTHTDTSCWRMPPS